MKTITRKPLTYGSASMHSRRRKNPALWRDRCYELSGKPDAEFYEECDIVYCEYRENGNVIKVVV